MKTTLEKPNQKAVAQKTETGTSSNNPATPATKEQPSTDTLIKSKSSKGNDLKKSVVTNTKAKPGTNKSQSPFEKLFLAILKDTYWAEKHIVESLPEMIEATTTGALKEALTEHLETTSKQVKRLEQVFEILEQKAEAIKCPVMEALVKEGNKMIEETPSGSMTRDASIIISCQKIEHYEIAAYGSLVQVALTLGHEEAAELLEQTLFEEEDTDIQLTEIAEADVNPLADDETSKN